MGRLLLKNCGGFMLVFSALVMALLLGFLAFGIDFGHVFSVQNQLQSAADGAALAGASALPQNLPGGGTSGAQGRARSVAAANTAGQASVNLSGGDVAFHRYNFATRQFESSGAAPNSVRVNAQRTTAQNGPVRTWFANLLNVDSVGVQEPATGTIEPAQWMLILDARGQAPVFPPGSECVKSSTTGVILGRGRIMCRPTVQYHCGNQIASGDCWCEVDAAAEPIDPIDPCPGCAGVEDVRATALRTLDARYGFEAIGLPYDSGGTVVYGPGIPATRPAIWPASGLSEDLNALRGAVGAGSVEQAFSETAFAEPLAPALRPAIDRLASISYGGKAIGLVFNLDMGGPTDAVAVMAEAARAKQLKIRIAVFKVCAVCGTVASPVPGFFVNESLLDALASTTGGRSYRNVSSSQIEQVMQAVAADLPVHLTQ